MTRENNCKERLLPHNSIIIMGQVWFLRKHLCFLVVDHLYDLRVLAKDILVKSENVIATMTTLTSMKSFVLWHLKMIAKDVFFHTIISSRWARLILEKTICFLLVDVLFDLRILAKDILAGSENVINRPSHSHKIVIALCDSPFPWYFLLILKPMKHLVHTSNLGPDRYSHWGVILKTTLDWYILGPTLHHSNRTSLW